MTVLAYDYCHSLEDSADTAAAGDWPESVDRVYQDLGGRGQLLLLYEDCRRNSRAIDAVWVRRLADLGETLQQVSDRLAEFHQLGVAVHAVEDDLYLPATAADATDAAPAIDVDLSLAQAITYQQRQRRIRQGHAKTRIQGQPPPGKAPYGYRRTSERYILDRNAAAIVRAFFDHFLLYGSLRRSVRYLADIHNKTISVSTGKRWLSSPVYRGDLAYGNGHVIPDAHAPVLSRDEAAQVDRLLRRNRQFAPRTSTAPRSLAGLVSCGRCHTPFVISKTTAKRGRRQRKTYLYLRPSHCPYRHQPQDSPLGAGCSSLSYTDVLERTIAQVCTELPRLVNQVSPTPAAAVQVKLSQQIDAKQRLLEKLPELEAQGILDRQTSALRGYTLLTEIATLRDELSQLPPASLLSIAQTVSIPQFWFDLSETERRFYFREFIQRIDLTQHRQDWDIALSYRF